MKLKHKIATLAATVALAAGGPLIVANVATSAAPAPVRAVATAVTDATLPKAEAAYPYQCRWVWRRIPTPNRWWVTPKYGFVWVCWQIPN